MKHALYNMMMNIVRNQDQSDEFNSIIVNSLFYVVASVCAVCTPCGARELCVVSRLPVLSFQKHQPLPQCARAGNADACTPYCS